MPAMLKPNEQPMLQTNDEHNRVHQQENRKTIQNITRC